jgi:hypothetical protein
LRGDLGRGGHEREAAACLRSRMELQERGCAAPGGTGSCSSSWPRGPEGGASHYRRGQDATRCVPATRDGREKRSGRHALRDLPAAATLIPYHARMSDASGPAPLAGTCAARREAQRCATSTIAARDALSILRCAPAHSAGDRRAPRRAARRSSARVLRAAHAAVSQRVGPGIRCSRRRGLAGNDRRQCCRASTARRACWCSIAVTAVARDDGRGRVSRHSRSRGRSLPHDRRARRWTGCWCRASRSTPTGRRLGYGGGYYDRLLALACRRASRAWRGPSTCSSWRRCPSAPHDLRRRHDRDGIGNARRSTGGHERKGPYRARIPECGARRPSTPPAGPPQISDVRSAQIAGRSGESRFGSAAPQRPWSRSSATLAIQVYTSLAVHGAGGAGADARERTWASRRSWIGVFIGLLFAGAMAGKPRRQRASSSRYGGDPGVAGEPCCSARPASVTPALAARVGAGRPAGDRRRWLVGHGLRADHGRVLGDPRSGRRRPRADGGHVLHQADGRPGGQPRWPAR